MSRLFIARQLGAALVAMMLVSGCAAGDETKPASANPRSVKHVPVLHEQWRLPKKSGTNPQLAIHDGKLITFDNNEIDVYDLKTGKQLWRHSAKWLVGTGGNAVALRELDHNKVTVCRLEDGKRNYTVVGGGDGKLNAAVVGNVLVTGKYKKSKDGSRLFKGSKMDSHGRELWHHKTTADLVLDAATSPDPDVQPRRLFATIHPDSDKASTFSIDAISGEGKKELSADTHQGIDSVSIGADGSYVVNRGVSDGSSVTVDVLAPDGSPRSTMEFGYNQQVATNGGQQIDVGGDYVLGSNTKGRPKAVALATGKTVWTAPRAAEPIGMSGRVAIFDAAMKDHHHRVVTAVDIEKDDTLWTRKWPAAANDAFSGRLAGHFLLDASSALLSAAGISAADPKTGKPAWRSDYSQLLTAGGGYVVAGSEQGNFSAVMKNAAPKD